MPVKYDVCEIALVEDAGAVAFAQPEGYLGLLSCVDGKKLHWEQVRVGDVITPITSLSAKGAQIALGTTDGRVILYQVRRCCTQASASDATARRLFFYLTIFHIPFLIDDFSRYFFGQNTSVSGTTTTTITTAFIHRHTFPLLFGATRLLFPSPKSDFTYAGLLLPSLLAGSSARCGVDSRPATTHLAPHSHR